MPSANTRMLPLQSYFELFREILELLSHPRYKFIKKINPQGKFLHVLEGVRSFHNPKKPPNGRFQSCNTAIV
jgi:hypothetical protein